MWESPLRTSLCGLSNGSTERSQKHRSEPGTESRYDKRSAGQGWLVLPDNCYLGVGMFEIFVPLISARVLSNPFHCNMDYQKNPSSVFASDDDRPYENTCQQHIEWQDSQSGIHAGILVYKTSASNLPDISNRRPDLRTIFRTCHGTKLLEKSRPAGRQHYLNGPLESCAEWLRTTVIDSAQPCSKLLVKIVQILTSK